MFEEGELAYLGLTGKVELPLRDKIAINLHNSLIGQRLTITREWKRTDLAVLYAGEPKMLIECKAMYTFDATELAPDPDAYPKKIDKDVEKALKLSSNDTEVYALLFATHPLKVIDSDLAGTVKYMDGINRAFKRFKNPDAIKKDVCQNMQRSFSGLEYEGPGSIFGGTAFGVDVEVLYWLIGPFCKDYRPKRMLF